MRSGWKFRALVEPTPKKFRVVFNGGRNQMQFFTEAEAKAFAIENSGTVEPITPRQFVLQPANRRGAA
jgi:hypothetical protein